MHPAQRHICSTLILPFTMYGSPRLGVFASSWAHKTMIRRIGRLMTQQCSAGGGSAAEVLALPFLGLSTLSWVGGTMLLSGVAVGVHAATKPSKDSPVQCSELAWVQEMERNASMEQVLSPGQLLREFRDTSVVGKIFLDEDHLVSTSGATACDPHTHPIISVCLLTT